MLMVALNFTQEHDISKCNFAPQLDFQESSSDPRAVGRSALPSWLLQLLNIGQIRGREGGFCLLKLLNTCMMEMVEGKGQGFRDDLWTEGFTGF